MMFMKRERIYARYITNNHPTETIIIFDETYKRNEGVCARRGTNGAIPNVFLK